jgi:ATP-dependent HslUV protease, peptidase subunit HslV
LKLETKQKSWIDHFSTSTKSPAMISGLGSAFSQRLLRLPSTLPSAHRLYHASTATTAAERHGTTILCVRKNGQVCLMGDGMVSQGNLTVKSNVRKIRRIQSKGYGLRLENETDSGVTLVGFAGSTADAFTLLERLENKLEEYPGQLKRSCVELAKGWRTDKYLRRLEASLIVADQSTSLEITGNGDVLESSDGILGVGSGSPFAIGTFLCAL